MFYNTRAGATGVAIAVLLSLAGLAVSGVLLLDHHVAHEVGAKAASAGLCKFGERFSCDEVISSRWGRFPFGAEPGTPTVPTAMLGFFFFAWTAAWYLVIGRPGGSRRGWHLVIVLLTAGGAGFAAYLDWVMFTQMPRIGDLAGFAESGFSHEAASKRPICPLCLATHILAGLLFILTLVLWPRRRSLLVTGQPAGRPTAAEIDVVMPAPDYPPLRLLVAAAVMAVVISVFGWSDFHRRINKHSAEQYHARWQEYERDYEAVYTSFASGPVVDIPVTEDDSVYGRREAPHTIVIFTDLQCEWCKAADKLLKEKVDKFPDQLRLVVKHFPMNKTCNTQVKGTLHAASCAAAVTVEAARLVGGDASFWQMYDRLFTDQAAFAKSAQSYLKDIAPKMGMDFDAIWKQINTFTAWNRIKRHVEEGGQIGVNATPAIYYDGRQVGGWGNSRFWDYLVFRSKGQPRPAVTATRPAASTQPTGAATRPAVGAGTATQPATTPAR